MPRKENGKNVSTVLDDDLYGKLEEIRTTNRVTASQVMRQALSLYHRLLTERKEGTQFIVRDGDVEKEVWIV